MTSILCCGEEHPLIKGVAICDKCRHVYKVDDEELPPEPERDYNLWIGAGVIIAVMVCLWLAWWINSKLPIAF